MPENLKTMVPQPRAYKKGPFTVEAPGFEKVKGETIPRRNYRTKDALKMRPQEDVATVYDILKYSSAKFGNAKAVGSRKLIEEHTETKKVKKMVDGKEEQVDKKWTFFEYSPYEYMSFVEFEKTALQIGAGFRAIGLNSPDRVHIFASTRSACSPFPALPALTRPQPSMARYRSRLVFQPILSSARHANGL